MKQTFSVMLRSTTKRDECGLNIVRKVDLNEARPLPKTVLWRNVNFFTKSKQNSNMYVNQRVGVEPQ